MDYGFLNVYLILRCLMYQGGVESLKSFDLFVTGPSNLEKSFQDCFDCIHYTITDNADNYVAGELIVIDNDRFYICINSKSNDLKFKADLHKFYLYHLSTLKRMLSD